MEMGENNLPKRVWLSAKTGEGLDLLQNAVSQFIARKLQSHRLCLPASAGKLRAKLFNVGAVEEEQIDADGGWIMQVNMETPRLQQLCEESGLNDIKLQSCLTSI